MTTIMVFKDTFLGQATQFQSQELKLLLQQLFVSWLKMSLIVTGENVSNFWEIPRKFGCQLHSMEIKSYSLQTSVVKRHE